MDPFQAIGSFILGKLKQNIIQEWARLLFGMAFSGLTAFLFVCGSDLAAGALAAKAIGEGMVAAAVVLVALFLRSRLTRGIAVAILAGLAKKESETDKNIIDK